MATGVAQRPTGAARVAPACGRAAVTRMIPRRAESGSTRRPITPLAPVSSTPCLSWDARSMGPRVMAGTGGMARAAVRFEPRTAEHRARTKQAHEGCPDDGAEDEPWLHGTLRSSRARTRPEDGEQGPGTRRGATSLRMRRPRPTISTSERPVGVGNRTAATTRRRASNQVRHERQHAGAGGALLGSGSDEWLELRQSARRGSHPEVEPRPEARAGPRPPEGGAATSPRTRRPSGPSVPPSPEKRRYAERELGAC